MRLQDTVLPHPSRSYLQPPTSYLLPPTRRVVVLFLESTFSRQDYRKFFPRFGAKKKWQALPFAVYCIHGPNLVHASVDAAITSNDEAVAIAAFRDAAGELGVFGTSTMTKAELITAIKTSNDASIACYWKNGNINNLHDTHSFGDAYDIAFKGNDFYISGEIDPQNTDSWNACYLSLIHISEPTRLLSI